MSYLGTTRVSTLQQDPDAGPGQRRPVRVLGMQGVAATCDHNDGCVRPRAPRAMSGRREAKGAAYYRPQKKAEDLSQSIT